MDPGPRRSSRDDGHELARLPDFLRQHVRVEPERGCWLWTRSLVSGGYGQVWVPRSAVLWEALADTPPGPKRVHRLTWTLLVGPLDRQDVLVHRCERRACCNPAHLERRAVDTVDTVDPAETATRGRRQATHCKRGHLLPPSGERRGGCVACTLIIRHCRRHGLPHPDVSGRTDPADYGLTPGAGPGRRRRATP